MNILVIDAQGGGIGRQLVTALKNAMPDATITAVGTNSAATAAMVKVKADKAATEVFLFTIQVIYFCISRKVCGSSRRVYRVPFCCANKRWKEAHHDSCGQFNIFL